MSGICSAHRGHDPNCRLCGVCIGTDDCRATEHIDGCRAVPGGPHYVAFAPTDTDPTTAAATSDVAPSTQATAATSEETAP